jgi:hypothetical protein
MRLAVLIGLCLSLAITLLFAKNSEVSQNRDLPPLRLAAADLDVILQKTHAFIAGANGPASEQDPARESVKLGIRGHEIEIPHFSLASSVAFPRELFGFSYTYGRPDKPISSVTIDLGDYSRRVSVSGEAADQVEAISNILENDLLHHSTAIGGATFRRVAGVCLSLTLLASLIVTSAYCWKTRQYAAFGMPIFSAVGLVLLFRLPWDRYLPGFALYQSNSPFFLIRHAPQVALLTLAATVAGIPLSYFFSRKQS